MDKNNAVSVFFLNLFKVLAALVAIVGEFFLFIGASHLFGFKFALALPAGLLSIGRQVVLLFNVIVPAIFMILAAIVGFIHIANWIIKADNRIAERQARKQAETQLAKDFKNRVTSKKPSRREKRDPQKPLKIKNDLPIQRSDPKPGHGITDT
ncbi:hypothetical protein ACFLZK_00255 [Patescibacteria group bacterium]